MFGAHRTPHRLARRTAKPTCPSCSSRVKVAGWCPRCDARWPHMIGAHQTPVRLPAAAA